MNQPIRGGFFPFPVMHKSSLACLLVIVASQVIRQLSSLIIYVRVTRTLGYQYPVFLFAVPLWPLGL